ncbi:nickel ABC transporter ATP-binding protein NikE (plasmid) [Paracoccus kondratievae]|uniref:ABC transporter ATP-binding protein n=1 Tax=Paracoccus kondratievae TaxID=135740 RepID=UPI0012665B0B|nr:ABC transporter ATP-binding protein [Paracoccus kondratievae]QFQ89743.1 nickel ABC transporter ATP-binding protein NikE [Paracoccus kondratievae]
MSHVLQIRDLRVEAPDGTVLLHGVSMDLNPGEVLGLIGESGAGKSTVALASMGYGRGGCRITGGEIRLAGTEMRTAPRQTREALRGTRIAYVAQSAAAAFNPAMRLERQILEVPRVHGLMNEAEARVWMTDLFSALQLPDPEHFGRRFPHQVSGGQLQRAMIAMAMAGKPDILVLDEPTTALDVTTQIEVLRLLRDVIRRYGTAALYITHDLAVIAQIADRLMVLRNGREVETGPTAALLDTPQQDYTRLLVAERHGSLTASQRMHNPGKDELLAIEGVDAFYGRTQVLHDVSLRLNRGETLAVVGESGSGKSTLARLIAGLLPPARGEVRLDGACLPPELSQRDNAQLRRVQLVYQLPDVALNPHQTVGEVIGRPLALFGGLRGRALKDEVARLLDQIGLPACFAARLPGALSGGQKQRVCIARALAAKPDLLICDEVTSALDPLVAEDILRLLLQLQDELGIAYLFITHDLSVVRRLADRVMVMQTGRIIETAGTATLFATPEQAYTRRLLAAVPELRTNWLDEVTAAH